MQKVTAAITAVGGYVPEYRLTNKILETMVDTNDEWIKSRTGIEERRILNDIRYTQALSMATGQRYRWVRTSATTYQIINSAGTALILPSGSTQATLTSNVSFGAFTNLPNNLIAFDSTGTPYTDTGSPGTPLAATAIIPAVIGSNTRSIQVTPSTGYGALQ